MAHAGVEGQQFFTSEGHAGRGRLVELVQLQLHVGARIAGLEQAVLFLEVEQRARGDGDDELVLQGGGHIKSIAGCACRARAGGLFCSESGVTAGVGCHGGTAPDARVGCALNF
ncbi:MAG: hypothetical protein R3E70_14855 [Burkholderiaceae bacterium]